MVHEFVATVISAHPKKSISGSRYLQKVCYFASRLTGDDLGLQSYFWGPSSRELVEAVGDLVTHGVIREWRQYRGFPSSLEPIVYVYDELDAVFVRDFQESEPKKHAAIQKATQRVLATGMAKSANSMAVAAKVHAIVSTRPGEWSVRELVASAREQGWGISEDDEVAIVDSLAQLGLVEREYEEACTK